MNVQRQCLVAAAAQDMKKITLLAHRYLLFGQYSMLAELVKRMG